MGGIGGDRVRATVVTAAREIAWVVRRRQRPVVTALHRALSVPKSTGKVPKDYGRAKSTVDAWSEG